MSATPVSLSVIENAIREVCLVLEEKSHQYPSWKEMTEDDLWRELVGCILGSRVRFESAYFALKRMERMGLLCHPRQSSDFNQYERNIREALAGNSLKENSVSLKVSYPFFRTRANQVRRAAEYLYRQCGAIRSLLCDAYNIREARRLLVTNVSGLGPKQASLFLRNIRYSENIAVLDIHVLTYMNWVGLTDTIVKSAATIPKYETLENIFINHSYSFGYTPDRFDLAVWVVVKAAKEEYYTWQ